MSMLDLLHAWAYVALAVVIALRLLIPKALQTPKSEWARALEFARVPLAVFLTLCGVGELLTLAPLKTAATIAPQIFFVYQLLVGLGGWWSPKRKST